MKVHEETHCVIQAKAKEVCEKGKIPYTAGSADKQWVSVAQVILPRLLKDVEREYIWNTDETGCIFRALPRRTLAVQCRKGMKIAKDRITVS